MSWNLHQHLGLNNKNRDTIYINGINKLFSNVKHLESCMQKSTVDIASQLGAARELFTKFIYYRYPYPNLSDDVRKWGISSQTDNESFYNTQNISNIKHAVFSVQAYLLRTFNWGTAALRQRELVEYITGGVKQNLTENTVHLTLSLFDVFVRTSMSLRNLRKSTTMLDESVRVIQNNLRNDEVLSLLSQTGNTKMLLADKSLAFNRIYGFNDDQIKALQCMVSVIREVSVREPTTTPELDPLLDTLKQLKPTNGSPDNSLLIRLLWFAALYQYILEEEQKKDSDDIPDKKLSNDLKSSDIIEFASKVKKKMQDVRDWKDKAGVPSRSSITISRDITYLKNELQKVYGSSVYDAELRVIDSKLDDLRSSMHVLRRPQKKVVFSGEKLDWFYKGLFEISSIVEGFSRGHSSL